MQDLAMSLDLHYFSLSGDLSAVNYSSARVGLLEERDVWKDLQRVVIDQFCREIFNAWLEAQILRGTISPGDAQAVNRPTWRPRGWQWVDPQKEVKAKVEAIQAGLTTYTATLAEQGIDLEEHLQTIKAERDLAASYDVDLLDLGGEKEEATQAPPPVPDIEED
jgi:lambda family phage portal protein